MVSTTTTSRFPDWLMLDRFVFWSDDFAFPNDPRTVASGTNSKGEEFDICFNLVQPPAVSRLYLRMADNASYSHRFDVLAAHRDALLLQTSYLIQVPDFHDCPMIEYFLYMTGGSRPSLERLPSIDGTMAEVQAKFKLEGFVLTNQSLRRTECMDMGVLCHGEKEVAVAELQITRSKAPPRLNVFCPSKSSRWKVKTNLQILPLHPKEAFILEELLWSWDADKVLPYGDKLCWIDYCNGILLCDVFEDSPNLQYLELPVQLPQMCRNLYSRTWVEKFQSVGVTKGGIMKFVNVVDGDGSLFGSTKPTVGFTVICWSLRRDSMKWEKDASIKANELWDLDGFAHLPRTPLLFPVVSMDDPSVVYFVLMHNEAGENGNETWIVAIDMINLTLKASFQYINPEQREDTSVEEAYLSNEKFRCFETFLPAEFSKHLNPHVTRNPIWNVRSTFSTYSNNQECPWLGAAVSYK